MPSPCFHNRKDLCHNESPPRDWTVPMTPPHNALCTLCGLNSQFENYRQFVQRNCSPSRVLYKHVIFGSPHAFYSLFFIISLSFFLSFLLSLSSFFGSFWLKVVSSLFSQTCPFFFCSPLFVRTVFAKHGSHVEVSGRIVWMGPDHPGTPSTFDAWPRAGQQSRQPVQRGPQPSHAPQGSVHSKTRV